VCRRVRPKNNAGNHECEVTIGVFGANEKSRGV
jgi:hypothetical protein